MIFSRWRPDTGGYDYFDSPSTRFGLGDDLPVPRLSNTTELGVASTDVGRPLPADAVHVGSGPIARGMIAPMSTSGLTGLGLDFSSPALKIGAVVIVAAGVGYWVGKKRSKR
jgi:hypothetical protein